MAPPGRRREPSFEGRGHFFAAAAEAMRRILIDRARQKLALKRGARAERVDLESLEVAMAADDDTLLAVDEAMEKLRRRNLLRRSSSSSGFLSG